MSDFVLPVLVVVVVVFLISVLSALPVMLLWNWLMPEIFGLVQIDFRQALGLTMLCSLLFKSSHTSSSK